MTNTNNTDRNKERNVSNVGDNQKTSAPQLNAKIKATWSKLGDSDIKLYNEDRSQFFSKLKEKQNVSREDGERLIKEMEKSSSGAKSAAE
ncbi:MAG: hypothetical protein KKA05_07670 [Alphaproteobacteria bacterium]|nr:hypothetical protein [Alphaproteobacteria bacterium]MBU0858430.1 hypothetical protein [Alphaproteobacteria bacterium]